MAAQGRGGNSSHNARMLALLTVTATMALMPPSALPADHGGPNFSGQLDLSDRMCSAPMRADARLADVCFVDPEHGWAVGDRGTIWHTNDGGQAWHLQDSRVDCRLESVCFVDRRIGWAAGGVSRPYTHAGSGVLLSTQDGGHHWTRTGGLLLPVLKRVRFFDHQHGWAVGTSSAMFPSGVFATEDGGKSWNPLVGAKITAWQGGDFLERNTGVLAGFDGTAAIVQRGGVKPARTPRFGLRRTADVELVPEVQPQRYGWLIGQGGLVMATADLGNTWQIPPGELPDGISAEFDFATVEVRGPKVWIAGSPGSRILHTADAGSSWVAIPTGQNLPIEALCFVDDQHGWAVGHLGTILATTDGGRRWTRQRSGGTRAALLGLFCEPDDIPLELLARLSGDEGYLAAVELVGRRDADTPSRTDVPLDDRLHEAVVGVGGSAARASWQFPLGQPELKLPAGRVVEDWNRVNDGRALEQLEAHLVRQIRLWRPEVVFTHAMASSSNEPARQIVHRAALQAVARAGDPTWYASQITYAGLEPWKVHRVYGSLGPEARGTATLTTNQLLSRLARTPADVAAGPRGLIADDFRPVPASFGFQLLVDAVAKRSGREDFFSGISLAPGGDARRLLSEPSTDALALMQRIARKRRNTQAILQYAQEDTRRGLDLAAQLGDLTRGLPPDSAGKILHQLAWRYYRTGEWSLAALAFTRLADRYPNHPLADAALTWLVQYHASSEVAWRVRGADRITNGEMFASGTKNPRSRVSHASATAIDPEKWGGPGNWGGPAEQGDFGGQDDRLERAAAMAKQLESVRPDLFARPDVGFPLAVVACQRGFPVDAERFYLGRARNATQDAWRACAQGEQWLAEPEGIAPKTVMRCARAVSKPRLDGRLDDPVWQRAEPARLQAEPDQAHVATNSGSPPLAIRKDNPRDGVPEVRLAYDAEFFYWAVRCPKAPGGNYDIASKSPRPRDPDLSARDRVDLLIDLDRDFVTYYRLAVDHRAWCHESCWGDRTWDPTWFVAGTDEGGTWTAEAAIPLDQLTDRYPTSGVTWAVGIQRTTPGVGFQSWTAPASPRVTPEGFGYLIFE